LRTGAGGADPPAPPRSPAGVCARARATSRSARAQSSDGTDLTFKLVCVCMPARGMRQQDGAIMECARVCGCVGGWCVRMRRGCVRMRGCEGARGARAHESGACLMNCVCARCGCRRRRCRGGRGGGGCPCGAGRNSTGERSPSAPPLPPSAPLLGGAVLLSQRLWDGCGWLRMLPGMPPMPGAVGCLHVVLWCPTHDVQHDVQALYSSGGSPSGCRLAGGPPPRPPAGMATARRAAGRARARVRAP